VFIIVISIIKSKIVAVLLGPSGIGIVGLLTSTTQFINVVTNFGLGTSGVQEIAAANGTGNQARIATIVIAFKRCMWIAGSIGALIALSLSPWLSELTFGNRDYTLAFVWISITVLFYQLNMGRLVILQGMRKLQYLAKANIAGGVLGLFITVPLYFWYGIDAIVPVIILSSICSLLCSRYFSDKIKIEHIEVSIITTIAKCKNMLGVGFFIAMNGLVGMGTAYIIRIYISNFGGLADVGLYIAGFTIINAYTGLIFNAMTTDYYPRLAAVAHSNSLCKQTINQQAEIAILILGPILLVFLIFIKWIIILLYSNKFVAISDMIYWAALGMFFKASAWSVGIVFIAKGNSKLLFLNDLLLNIYTLALSVIGFHFWGLKGLGISFMICYILNLIQVSLVSKMKYDFVFLPAIVKIFTIQFILAISSFVAVKFLRDPYPYLVGLVLIGISTWYSYRELDKRLDLKSIYYKYKPNYRT